MTPKRMQPVTVQKLLDTVGRPDARLGHPDGNKGSDFFELESAHNLFLTLNLPFSKYFEYSEIYGIHVYDNNIT